MSDGGRIHGTVAGRAEMHSIMDDVEFVMSPGAKVPVNVFEEIANSVSGCAHLIPIGSLAAQWSFEGGLAVIAFEKPTMVRCNGRVEGRVVGFARLSYLVAGGETGSWTELGSVWIDRCYRGTELEAALCSRLIERHADTVNILASTASVASQRVCEDLTLLDFVLVARKRLPEAVWKSCCQCPRAFTKATDPENGDCSFAYGESQCAGRCEPCRMYVSPQTAERFDFDRNHFRE